MPLRFSPLIWCGLTLLTVNAFGVGGRADALNYNVSEQGGFVAALCRDGRGNLWVGTEDKGVARFDGKSWKSFGTGDGLGDDNAYALACDHQGRVWAGHLNHGVSVWNGSAWKNYPVGTGPLGERVFALAVSPVDGDVWMATNAGLSRYSIKNNNWTHYSRATGMPNDELSCLAFDSGGHLLVGTQCEGILMGSPVDGFKSWRQSKAEDDGELPLAPNGEGLPSNQINDLLVYDDGTLYAATAAGVAQSGDGGKTWGFVRGADWRKKAAGLTNSPVIFAEPPKSVSQQLLREDYVTKLAEDARGLLWIGYRRQGYEARRSLADPATVLSPATTSGNFPYVGAMLPLEEGSMAVGYYNQGVSLSDQVALETRNEPGEADNAGAVTFPTVAGVPDAGELERLLALVQGHAKTPDQAPSVALLSDDWMTEGDWLGRYGRSWADLCAMISPGDLLWGAGDKPVEYKWTMGPHHSANDSPRYWVHWLYTDWRRTLEMTPMYSHSRLLSGYATDAKKLRRQSEVNDNGGAYPMEQQGPNLRCVLKVPEGNFVLSLYDNNKDGHDDFNRARDYIVSIRPHDPKLGLAETSDFDEQPELARARLRDFWGGVWKRFFVRGPQELTVEVNRNYSVNTIMAGAFLDPLDEEPSPYFNLPGGLNQASDGERLRSSRLKTDLPGNEAAENLWAALETARHDDPQWWSASSRLFYGALNRYYEEARAQTPAEEMGKLWVRLGTCRRALDLMDSWEEAQRQRGLVPARDIEHGIRWDGRNGSNGQGLDVVSAYSTAKAGLEWWEKNKNALPAETKETGGVDLTPDQLKEKYGKAPYNLPELMGALQKLKAAQPQDAEKWDGVRDFVLEKMKLSAEGLSKAPAK